eukprot:3633314-Pyramimonas_sp.AAC.1
MLLSGMEGRRLPISWDKCGLSCSGDEVFRKVRASARDLWPEDVPFPGRDAFHRDLAGDAIDGRMRRISTQVSRVSEAMQRGVRIKALQGLG